jgi:hypothetical protein
MVFLGERGIIDPIGGDQQNTDNLYFSAAGYLGFAEREGFEPSVPPRSTTVFETAPFDHSGISPVLLQK